MKYRLRTDNGYYGDGNGKSYRAGESPDKNVNDLNDTILIDYLIKYRIKVFNYGGDTAKELKLVQRRIFYYCSDFVTIF